MPRRGHAVTLASGPGRGQGPRSCDVLGADAAHASRRIARPADRQPNTVIAARASHHHRRYSEARLRSVLVSAGLAPSVCTYLNALLLPTVAARRLLERTAGIHTGGDLAVLPRPANWLLATSSRAGDLRC